MSDTAGQPDGTGPEVFDVEPASTDALDETVVDIDVGAEMRQSFLDYAMSVITSRALPDARDGLKPVHRRILWSMYDMGLRPDRPHKKCATVVGDVIANYHPHGDNSIYEALVRMGQSFSLPEPLVDPHGNFGSPSDPPAAYRYTECRLTQLAMSMLEGIGEDTVDLTQNFDGSRNEPVVLPARFPNLLVNGSQGIAVGMATSIPTHNLNEVIAATVHLINHPEATVADLVQFVQAPDFPTGGAIMGTSGALEAYHTGRGSVRIRAEVSVEEEERRGGRLIVTEIPYQTSVESIEEKIAELTRNKRLEGVRAVRNESSKGQTRLVIELKAGANAQIVLNNLYKHTPLETKHAINMLALVDGQPRTLNLRDMLAAYVDHQLEVVRRRSEHRLNAARERAHIVEGLLKALDMIDAIVAAIRASEDRAEALRQLTAEPFTFSERQANHILDMQLVRLTRLGRANLEEELEGLRTQIAELEAILADDGRLRAVIVTELTEISEAHQSERRTRIEPFEGDLLPEDFIDDEPVVVTLSAAGYIKAMAPDEFRTQGRGGIGVKGTNLGDDDVPVRVLATSAHSDLLFFTSKGKVYRLKAYALPRMSRTSQGRSVVNFLKLADGETVAAIIVGGDFDDDGDLVFVTALGKVKRTAKSAFANIRSNGLRALQLNEGDELARVVEAGDEDDLLMVAASGRTIRFSVGAVRRMGRTAAGVIGMRLRDDRVEGDRVVAADVLRPDDGRNFLMITDAGYGKRVETDLFPAKGRGGLGVWGIKLREGSDGAVVGARLVEDDDELLAFSTGGTMLRTEVASISMQGRAARGVRVMRLRSDEKVATIAPYDVEVGEEPSTEEPGTEEPGTKEAATATAVERETVAD